MTSFFFGTRQAEGVNVVNAGTITLTTPAADAEGPADVVVTNPGGGNATSPAAFTYTPDA